MFASAVNCASRFTEEGFSSRSGWAATTLMGLGERNSEDPEERGGYSMHSCEGKHIKDMSDMPMPVDPITGLMMWFEKENWWPWDPW